MTEAIDAGSKAPKVLVADDDPSVVDFIAGRCARMGFDVKTASNGLQALVVARQTRPDVLIVDLHMPELDGLSLCQRLLNPTNKGCEVILITGNSRPDTLERCEGFGVVFGQKGPDLWNVVRSALVDLYPKMPSEIEARPERDEMRARSLVLVVDDDPDVGGYLTSRLAKCGVDTIVAPDGIRGYRIAIRVRPNVIISDYFMPDGDIHYLLWRLRSTPQTEKVPVIVMSGRDLDQPAQADLMKEVCGRPGAAQFFRKPFEIDKLFLTLREYCAMTYEQLQEAN